MLSKKMMPEVDRLREQANTMIRRVAEQGVRVRAVSLVISYESLDEDIEETTQVNFYVEPLIRHTHDDFGPRIKPDHLMPGESRIHRF